MKYTSAEAAKLLRKLNEDLTSAISGEHQRREFVAAVGEDVESVRPEYDFEASQKTIAEIQKKIRTVKHAINAFNLKTQVPGFDMTIDQLLVYIPQLTARKAELALMKARLPKERQNSGFGRSGSIIEYMYANYDIKKAEEEYERIAEELSKAQTALDLVNTTATLEIKL